MLASTVERFRTTGIVKKWFIRPTGDEFSSDDRPLDSGSDQEFEVGGSSSPFSSCENDGDPHSSSRRVSTATIDVIRSPMQGDENDEHEVHGDKRSVRIFVGSWNVAGRVPSTDLHFDEWLIVEDPADLYVLGFQEVVPLNASNVIGSEDEGPVASWENLIRYTLNTKMQFKGGRSPMKSRSHSPASIKKGRKIEYESPPSTGRMYLFSDGRDPGKGSCDSPVDVPNRPIDDVSCPLKVDESRAEKIAGDHSCSPVEFSDDVGDRLEAEGIDDKVGNLSAGSHNDLARDWERGRNTLLTNADVTCLPVGDASDAENGQSVDAGQEVGSIAECAHNEKGDTETAMQKDFNSPNVFRFGEPKHVDDGRVSDSLQGSDGSNTLKATDTQTTVNWVTGDVSGCKKEPEQAHEVSKAADCVAEVKDGSSDLGGVAEVEANDGDALRLDFTHRNEIKCAYLGVRESSAVHTPASSSSSFSSSTAPSSSSSSSVTTSDYSSTSSLPSPAPLSRLPSSPSSPPFPSPSLSPSSLPFVDEGGGVRDCINVGESGEMGKMRFVKIGSKQMVGVYVSVWIRADLIRHVHSVKVCCVGCGLMGVLGNKGAVALSMSLHNTSFCFVCSHLTSGDREGDELRRDYDFAEILRRTVFLRSERKLPSGQELPETILEHDRAIWFGDLNYRLTMADWKVRDLIEKEDWLQLIDRDQLRAAKLAGRVFNGWQEGHINFPPTYKYVAGEDQKAGDVWDMKRSPAWCDRILWRGADMHQLMYSRAEIPLSDHLPVHAVFLTTVDTAFSPKPLRQQTAGLWPSGDGVAGRRQSTDGIGINISNICTLQPQSVNLGDVRYADPAIASVALINAGACALNFTVVHSSGGANSGDRWVTVSPTHGVVDARSKFDLTVVAWVDFKVVDCEGIMEQQGGDLRTVLVVQIEKMGGLFLSIEARYLSSCWAISMSRLSSLPQPVRQGGNSATVTQVNGNPSTNSVSSSNSPTATAGDSAKGRRAGMLPTEFIRMVKFLMREEQLNCPGMFDQRALDVSGVEYELWRKWVGVGTDEQEVRGSPAPRERENGEATGSNQVDIETDAPGGNLERRVVGAEMEEKLRALLKTKGESGELSYEEVEMKIGRIREALDTGAEFPKGIRAPEMGIALLSFLSSLPTPLIPNSVVELVDTGKVKGLSRDGGISLVHMSLADGGGPLSQQRMVFDSLMQLVCGVLDRKGRNWSDCKELAARMAHVLFPRDTPNKQGDWQARTEFTERLINQHQ
ncbi:hypothetical protein CBR_g12806 [Chara braunii]|uniref:Inositol polyphosphate-related phosphatase domain-containing protein n=1 Tax=Chara braunii TaxID=69332 RepID=A0A388KSQ4_CHABU|nr:hypothetical protein CBR_g12806 [Chara braunii]|eukprot:GBG73090.1 hypothetical protein CBR_g12806 [Chara braunii]